MNKHRKELAIQMTNKKAIRILHDLHNQWCQEDNIYCTDMTGAICEALDMAMDALERKIGSCARINSQN
jgi:hypothetical protein